LFLDMLVSQARNNYRVENEMRKLTKADIPELRKAMLTDQRIANNPKHSPGARAAAEQNIAMVKETISKLEKE
jgi:hypothetical protein